MIPHVIVAAAVCLALIASGIVLWKGLGNTPAERKLAYELVPLVQLAMVAYAAACASIWSDGTALSYAVSVAGLIQAAFEPLLAKGLGTAEKVENVAAYANIMGEQLAAQQAHLERSQRANHELEKTREALANQFSRVATVLEAGDAELAKAALEDTERTIPTRGDRLCRNAALDALLKDKQRTCEERGIALNLRVGLAEEIGIPSTEACAIIANLLDNAINACKPLAANGDRPTITLAARETKARLVIKVENPYAARPFIASHQKGSEGSQSSDKDCHKQFSTSSQRDAGDSRSKDKQPNCSEVAMGTTTASASTLSKLDLANLPTHGWGTGIVKALTERHNGSFETEATATRFTATALILISNQIVK